MVRVGIIGLGFMGRMHYGAYQEIPGAGRDDRDANPKRAAGDLSDGWANVPGAMSNNSRWTASRGTTDWQSSSHNPDVDIVDVCLPRPHLESIPSIADGGNTCSAKSRMAPSSADGQTIAAAAAKAKGFFMPAMCMRFWAEWEWLKQAVADELTAPSAPPSSADRAPRPADGSATASSPAAHCSICTSTMPTSSITSSANPRPSSPAATRKDTGEIDHMVTQYLYDSPASSPPKLGHGRRASASACNSHVNFDRATAEFEFGREKPLACTSTAKSQPVDHPTHNGYVGELRYLIDCINNGTSPTRVTADDAVMGLKIIEAERQSAPFPACPSPSRCKSEHRPHNQPSAEPSSLRKFSLTIRNHSYRYTPGLTQWEVHWHGTPHPRPTDSELAILRQSLWKRGPSTVRDVYEQLNRDRPTGYTTALKLMQIMFEKGYVIRDERNQSHVYSASRTEGQTQKLLIRDLVDRAFGG